MCSDIYNLLLKFLHFLTIFRLMPTHYSNMSITIVMSPLNEMCAFKDYQSLFTQYQFNVGNSLTLSFLPAEHVHSSMQTCTATLTSNAP